MWMGLECEISCQKSKQYKNKTKHLHDSASMRSQEQSTYTREVESCLLRDWRNGKEELSNG